jgi:hypothetical protein
MSEQQLAAYWLLLVIGTMSGALVPMIENRLGKIAIGAFALLCALPVFLRIWFFAVLGG